jgi:hypothetical protein
MKREISECAAIFVIKILVEGRELFFPSEGKYVNSD